MKADTNMSVDDFGGYEGYEDEVELDPKNKPASNRVDPSGGTCPIPRASKASAVRKRASMESSPEATAACATAAICPPT